jgi:outer membrane immunogenic protein
MTQHFRQNTGSLDASTNSYFGNAGMKMTKAGAWLAATALATVLGAILPVQSSIAADLPLKAKPIVAATFDWSGVYIGAHAGYGGGMKDWEPGGISQADFIARGALAGGQIGINKQLGSFVFGMELAGSWADISGRQHFDITGPAFISSAFLDHASKIDGLATIAGRAGLAADRWFVFAKAGLSAAHEKHSANFLVVAVGGNTNISAGGNEVRYAPMLGFGSEYALDGNWSVFGEYDFHYFGARTIPFRGTTTAGALSGPISFDQRIDQSIHVAKVGVNYRWGGVAIDPSYPAVRPGAGNNWTGGYVGVQGGYGWGSRQWADGFGAPRPDYRTDGWLAGGTIGANAQAGSFVFGVEGEILGTGIRGNQTAAVPVVGATSQTNIFDSKIDWLALATARAGYVVGSNLMLYGKGGVAIAEEKHTLNLAQTGPTTTALLSAQVIHTGVVAGAGAEYAIAPNWSVKAEYDYVRMFQQAVMLAGTATGGPFGAGSTLAVPVNKMQQDLHLVKFGVNYHFNPLQVVVAKY